MTINYRHTPHFVNVVYGDSFVNNRIPVYG